MMQKYSKRQKFATAAATTTTVTQPLVPPGITREQEFSVMVSALRNVVVGNTNPVLSQDLFHFQDWTATASTSSSAAAAMINGFGNGLLPVSSDLDTSNNNNKCGEEAVKVLPTMTALQQKWDWDLDLGGKVSSGTLEKTKFNSG
ncbi:hypothetical protein Patl1_36133 [Pistacia atlantica]|nr:hypothetical protein Patl1_36133 [Pistacia atlantica]